MLKYKLIHPELLEALARSGHHDQILIADGNFPVHSKPPSHARFVHLNLAPGMLTVTDILKVMIDAVPLESATMMIMDDGKEPAISSDFRQILPKDVLLKSISRLDFYNASGESNTTLVIASGEQRLYANILLTIGVVKAG
ncbi:MAG: RbsD/FucU family protein [Leptolinea sp.]